MVTYDLMLERQRLVGADKFSIAAHANETVCLRFHFDKSWRKFDSKAAVFRNQKGEFYIIEILQCRAKVPWEVLTENGSFEVSLIGFEDKNVLTSDKVEIIVTENLLPEDCHTLQPSEVLFDRFKRECIAQAYLDYKDEIDAIKRAHAEEKMLLGEKINEANKATKEAIEAKNAEINALTHKFTAEIQDKNSLISQLNSDLNYASEKAEKWDIVNHAIGLKTYPTAALWAGGSEEYSLPMLNTSAIPTFSASNFSENLNEIGLDMSSVTTLSGVFLSHRKLTNVTFINTDKITSMENSFNGCSKLRSITLGKLNSCSNFKRFVSSAKSLERILFEGELACNNFERAFDGCLSLKVIEGIIDLGFATNVTSMFGNCVNLETVHFKENSIKTNIDLGGCLNLSKESIISVANALSANVSCNLILSDYAFQNKFPEGEEKSAFLKLVKETKGWTLLFE